MALTSLSVILAVIVSNINNRGFHQKKLPSCVLTFITLTSKLVCYKLEYIHKVKYEEIKSSSFKVVVKRNKKKYTRAHPSDSGCNLIEFDSSDKTAYSSRAVEDSNLIHRATGTHRNRAVQVSGTSENTRSWEAEEILSKLQILLNKEEEKLHELALMKQWQEVAEVIDRLLFWMFVLSTLFCSLSILVFIPMTKSKQTIDIED